MTEDLNFGQPDKPVTHPGYERVAKKSWLHIWRPLSGVQWRRAGSQQSGLLAHVPCGKEFESFRLKRSVKAFRGA